MVYFSVKIERPRSVCHCPITKTWLHTRFSRLTGAQRSNRRDVQNSNHHRVHVCLNKTFSKSYILSSRPSDYQCSGGLELLFSNQKIHKIEVPESNASGSPFTVGDLIHYLAGEVVQQDKKDFFVLDGTVYVLFPLHLFGLYCPDSLLFHFHFQCVVVLFR